jgi:hypothetical protein
MLTAIAQTLGEGYAIHKQDVFVRKQFKRMRHRSIIMSSFLQSYFRYFTGRTVYGQPQTYLTITQEEQKEPSIVSYDSKKWRDFLVKIRKVKDLLKRQWRTSEIPDLFAVVKKLVFTWTAISP